MDLVEKIFGGDYPAERLTLYQIVARAVLIYIVGLFVIRIGKGRLVGRVTGIDILVGMILGSLLSRGITGHASLTGTTAASLGIILAHWVITWIGARWHRFGDLTKGHAVQIVGEGKVLLNRMKECHISLHDLSEAARLQGVSELSEIRHAFKERNGDISIIKYVQNS
ncbi:DUF421 domain-containing protein [bacterium]|nr:DUF421 domain-containing protein [bacterium]